MTLLEQLGGREEITNGIVSEFLCLCRVPHGSGHEEAVGALLMEKLTALGAVPVRDSWGNIMADLPATPGCDGAPRLIIQGHMDMVCAVAPGSGYDPLRDAVCVVTEGGVLRSDGRSSLGADNNLGNAAALWITARGIRHGPLRFLFTVSEEVGLAGAQQVNPDWLKGARYLLNTDGFHLGQAIVGSAGGCRATYTRNVETVPAPKEGQAVRVTVSGGLGGHSGDDIHKGRSNAIALLFGLLEDLPTLPVFSLRGGTAHNAIPTTAEISLILKPGLEASFKAQIDSSRSALAARYGTQEPGLTLFWEDIDPPAAVWTPAFCGDVRRLLADIPFGEYEMHPDWEGVVDHSCNLGQVVEENGMLSLCVFSRYSTDEDGARIAASLDGLALEKGFSLCEGSCYPCWPGDMQNPLALAMGERFFAETGGNIKLAVCHVGLEPSVFRAKHPALIMVCTGPDIFDAHSVSEHAPLAGLADFAVLLAAGMEAVASLPE